MWYDKRSLVQPDARFMKTPIPESDVAIFARLLETSSRRLTPALARYLLSLGFLDTDQARMAELAERNQEGSISGQEKEELMSYVKAGHLLAVLQSKARKALKAKQVS